jgi:polysaccharide pyruvyl transferase WcaK-like protein
MASTQLYIESDLAARAEAAQSGAFLVGGYAGYPNFGDYLQLKSTVDLHEQIGAHHALYMLLDAWGREAHERNKISFGANGRRVLPVYYDCGGSAPASGLNGLVRLPHVPSSMLVHVYGGGFINDWWGRAVRLAVCALVERHAQDNIDGQLRLFMSGLQVSPPAEVNAWRRLFTRAEYIGARDLETVALLKGLLGDSAARIQFSGDDSLLALAASCGARADSTLSIAAHINLADYSSNDPDRRLERVARALAAAAGLFGAGVHCDLLVAYPSDHVREEEAVRQLEAFYRRTVAAGEAPHLTFRVRNIFEEATSGTFRFGASFLVTCSYHVALTGLLSHCPTLLLAENDYYRQKAAGLSEAFNTHRFASVLKDDDIAVAVNCVLEQRTNRLPGNGSYSMWIGQAEKMLRLSRICLDMERAVARNQLGLTASAFREVAADLGELRKRRILEERLAENVEKDAAITFPIPARGGLAKILKKSFWMRAGATWLRTVKRRINKWA